MRTAELFHGFRFDLAGALAGDVEASADLFQPSLPDQAATKDTFRRFGI